MYELQIWMTILSGELRTRHARLAEHRTEQGATTLEYVVIAAAVFGAAVILVAAITAVITRETNKIQ
jgi:Flp pilus assembly pilin Flp